MPKKYVIKVDRRSIRRNIRAGETQSAVARPPSIHGRRLKMRKTYCAIEDFTARRCQVTMGDDGFPEYKPWGVYVTAWTRYEIGSPAFFSELPCRGGNGSIGAVITPKDKLVIELEISSNNDIFNHAPIRTYDYRYASTKIRCQHCNAQFSHRDLSSREEMTSDRDSSTNEWEPTGDVYSLDDICPKCDRADCGEYEYEEPGTAMLAQCARRNAGRKALLKKIKYT